MALEDKTKLELEIAHVLFIDTVGYSKLRIHEQRELFDELNRVVRDTAQFRAAEASGKLTRLPTGDGMALVFTTSVETPVECAVGNRARAQSNIPGSPFAWAFIAGPSAGWWMSTIKSMSLAPALTSRSG